MKELQSKIDVLKKHNLFEGFSLSTLRSLCFCTTPITKKLRDVVFDFGSLVTGFYLLIQGEIAIFVKPSKLQPSDDTNQDVQDAMKVKTSAREITFEHVRTRVIQDPNSLLEEYFAQIGDTKSYYRAVVVSDQCSLLYIPFDQLKKTFGGSQHELDLLMHRCTTKRDHYRLTGPQKKFFKPTTSKTTMLKDLIVQTDGIENLKISTHRKLKLHERKQSELVQPVE